jgi:hypothetical protein
MSLGEEKGLDIFLYICLTRLKTPLSYAFGGLQRGKEVGDNMKGLQQLAYILVIIGALNWGLIGLFNLNLVNAIFSSMEWLEKTIYVLVGLSGILMLVNGGKK